MTRRPARVRRRTALLGSALAAALVVTGCSGDDAGDGDVQVNVQDSASGSKPGTDGNPSSDSPTGSAVPGSSGQVAEVISTIATGLQAPWGLAFLPDGTAVMTERDTARVLAVSPGDGGAQGQVTPIGTVGEAAPMGEGGLLGVAVSPTFAQDQLLFFYVSTADDNRVVSATFDGQSLGATTPILTGIPLGPIHDGGRMVFGPDGMLYVGTGETGVSFLAQDKDSLAGKILRITPEGKAAPGNPFDTPIWSFGHRNVQGLTFAGDQLWAAEFGQNRFDELNRIEDGANYGWPDVEGTGGTEAGYVDPQVTWATDVASPSGIAFADDAIWMAALRGNRLWKIPLSQEGAQGQAGSPEAYFIGDYGRLRTVALAPDGNLWLTTSNRDGRGDPAAQDDRILLVNIKG